MSVSVLVGRSLNQRVVGLSPTRFTIISFFMEQKARLARSQVSKLDGVVINRICYGDQKVLLIDSMIALNEFDTLTENSLLLCRVWV